MLESIRRADDKTASQFFSRFIEEESSSREQRSESVFVDKKKNGQLFLSLRSYVIASFLGRVALFF